MAKKAKGPKREDGYLLFNDGVMEQRAYVAEDGIVEVWTFVGDIADQTHSFGPKTSEGLRRMFRERDETGK